MRERWTIGALRRLPGLLVGLVGFGFGIALMARSDLGLGPWEVLNQGVGIQLGIHMGTVSILLGVPILLCWLPLREWPGPGTLINLVLIGLATNVGLAVLPVMAPNAVVLRGTELLSGVLLIGVCSGLYLAADLGPGPRDGLMTGLHHRFCWSIAPAPPPLPRGLGPRPPQRGRPPPPPPPPGRGGPAPPCSPPPPPPPPGASRRCS